MKPPVIFVSGPPGSGKTSIADRLAAEIELPLIARDEIKELILDRLGAGDVGWSKTVGGLSYELLYQTVERELRAGRSFIVESNFPSERGRARLLALQETYGFRPFEIHCTATNETLLSRYVARASTRHPGHNDLDRVGDVESALHLGTYAPLHLGGSVVILDTTEFETLDVHAVVTAVAEHLADGQR